MSPLRNSEISDGKSQNLNMEVGSGLGKGLSLYETSQNENFGFPVSKLHICVYSDTLFKDFQTYQTECGHQSANYLGPLSPNKIIGEHPQQFTSVTSKCVLCSCRLSLPDPYIGPDGVDFICSQRGHDGMTHCADDIPLWTENGVPCNGTSQSSSVGAPTVATSCVNWNQYYTVCKTGLSNPYRGSISFDNIGLAWVAIFQVTYQSCLSTARHECMQ